MSELSDRALAALGWAYGAIQGATYQGLGTADIWQSLRDAAESQGFSSVGLSGADVSVLRGYAGGMKRASDTFGAADAGQPLTADMIGVQPWALPGASFNAAPEWWARVEMTVADEQGNLSTGWATMTGLDLRGLSVGDITRILQANAEAAALQQGEGTTPRGTLISTGRVELFPAPSA